jgi:hypothetical protein
VDASPGFPTGATRSKAFLTMLLYRITRERLTTLFRRGLSPWTEQSECHTGGTGRSDDRNEPLDIEQAFA